MAGQLDRLFIMNDKSVNLPKLDDNTLAGMVKRRASNAEAVWQTDPYNLKKVRESNNKLYTTDYINDWVTDERYQDIVADNRNFTSIRSIVPFVTSRITQPEITSADGRDISVQFAADFEKILVEHAERQMARDKIKLSVQDNLRGQRIGVLKWRYDRATDTIVLEHCDPDSIIIDEKARLHEEPSFLQHTQERSIGDLIKQFPDKKEQIFELFSIQKGVPSQLEEVKKVTENWLWIDYENKRELVVCWLYENFVFGKTKDPNWAEGRTNVIERQMVPFIWFNVLNDGSSLIDQTSFIEQAQYLQKNYDKREMAIAENAKYGGIGVPVFASGAITSKAAAKIKFSPIQRVLLKTSDINKAFATWQAGNLPNFIVEDKYDVRNSIDNMWGTPNIFRGEQSKNNTLGQDIIIRDQAEGRQQELVDCIDNAMERFYKLEAQMIYRYFDEEKYYRYLGEDGKFEQAVISQEKIAKNFGIVIKIKAGSSMPVDRSQKRATALKLGQMNKLGTLRLYKELGLENPEQAFKEYLLEQTNPQVLLDEVDQTVFDREAQEDLAIVMGGGNPEERDDISEPYLNYLNEYLLTDKFKFLPVDTQARVSEFVDAIIAKAQRKADKLQMQTEMDNPMNGAQQPLWGMAGMGEQVPAPQPDVPSVLNNLPTSANIQA